MRISDWSSDVCSSDLGPDCRCCRSRPAQMQGEVEVGSTLAGPGSGLVDFGGQPARPALGAQGGDRKSVVYGQSVAVSVDLGRRRIIKKKYNNIIHYTLDRQREGKYKLLSVRFD